MQSRSLFSCSDTAAYWEKHSTSTDIGEKGAGNRVCLLAPCLMRFIIIQVKITRGVQSNKSVEDAQQLPVVFS